MPNRTSESAEEDFAGNKNARHYAEQNAGHRVWAVGFFIITVLYRMAVSVKLETKAPDIQPLP